MAFASPLKDIEDKYFGCSVCLEKFKDPKLLPCAHRYCRPCLKGVIDEHRDEFKCPLCNYVCDIPPEGVDGFRTDFHMKSLLQYIQLQQTAKAEDTIAACGGCLKEERAISYCFKCKGFLCGECHQIHMTRKMMQEHKPSVLSLKDIREEKLTLEKLSAITEAPRCNIHVEEPAKVCCGTCANLPICMVCGTVGKHKGHELHDVTELAAEERRKMDRALAVLERYREDVLKLPERMQNAKKALADNVTVAREYLRAQYKRESAKMRRKQEDIGNLTVMKLAEIDEAEKHELMVVEEERQNEIGNALKKINAKYDEVVEGKKVKFQSIRNEQQKIQENNRSHTSRTQEMLDKEHSDLEGSVNIQAKKSSKELETVSVESDNRIRRFDNFCSSVSSILAARDRWTDVQCLPDFGPACASLMEDVKKEYSEIEKMPSLEMRELAIPSASVTISEQAESVIDIAGLKGKGWAVQSITTTDGGVIVITGQVDNEHTHITVTNTQGEVIRQIEMEHAHMEGLRLCSCSALSLFNVVRVCPPDEVTIYGIRDGAHRKIDMSDVCRNWSEDGVVTCVTTDSIRREILVGMIGESGSSSVLIFDDKLGHLRTLKLPDMIEGPVDITLHEENILVCDMVCRKTFALTKDGPGAELVYELPKPHHKGYDWTSFRVCSCSRGLIYVLWVAVVSGQEHHIVTQYTQDGRQLLNTTIPVDEDAVDITTLITEDSEKLLLAAGGTGKLYIYGLTPRETP